MARLLSSLPNGALIKDSGTTYNGAPIIWRVLEHGHTGDPTGTTALESRDIITLKCFDAKEPSNSDSNRKSYGNNRYLYSNILQWLNSDSASWYTAKHSADQKPDSANVWQSSGTAINPYDTEAGFLTNFSDKFKAAIQTTTKITAKNTVTDGGGYESVASKVFMLSTTEVGLANENNIAEGSIYAYYSANNTNDRRKKNLANDAAKGNYSSASSPWFWWLRTPDSGRSGGARLVDTDGSLGSYNAFSGRGGVVPGLCVLSSLTVSDSTDSDGCYVIQWNAAPTVTVDSTSLGDKNAAFDIEYVIGDADSDAVSATLSIDGTVKQTISSVTLGATNTYTVSTAALRAMTAGSHTVTITATDSKSASTTVNLTFQRTVSQVTISGSDGSLGNKWLQPSITYQVGDSARTHVDVVEKIDGEAVRTISDAELDADIAFDMSSFATLSDNATHTLVIEATNEDAQTATRTWTFTKLPGELSFYTNTIPTDAAAKKINVVVNYEKAGDPTLRVEVSNDANAVQRHWEDATAAVLANEAYTFSNVPESAEDYGVSVRVTVTKSASTERVYVNSLGFSFS